MWGNFKVGYLDNELVQVDRGLYGGNVHYQTLATTEYGEQRLSIDGFAAEPGTVPSREEFRGTDGSLYFLRRQDILVGSERLRVEVRDKDSQLVTGVVHLRPERRLRHRLSPGPRPAHRAAVLDRGRQPARAQRRVLRRRGSGSWRSTSSRRASTTSTRSRPAARARSG